LLKLLCGSGRRRTKTLAEYSRFYREKLFGGRMASQAQADGRVPGLKGIAFLGSPLHPADNLSTARADHLTKLQIPLLFIQGTRDKLANPGLLRCVMESLGPASTIHLIDEADHGFHKPKRTGRMTMR
jgi:uncharacterized protein